MSEKAHHRQLGLLLAIVLPLAAIAFLWSASFFDNYQGEVIAYRPLEAADGKGDKARCYLLVRPGGSYEDVQLPSVAFNRWDLPLNLSGVPPLRPDEDADKVPVKKALFSFTVEIGGDGWSTLRPQDIILPVLFIIVSILARNLFVTGSAFQLVPGKGSKLPGLRQAQSGVPTRPPKARPKKGPPPTGRGRRKRRR